MCVCVYIYMYIYINHIFSIHSSVDDRLGCFCVLVVINSASVNTVGPISFPIRVFVFFQIYIFIYIYFFLDMLNSELHNIHCWCLSVHLTGGRWAQEAGAQLSKC